MERQSISLPAVLFIVALLAAALALGACGMAPPSMGYQGLLTNPQGTPVADGNYDLEFRLFQTTYNAQGTPEPVQVFTQTSTLAVDHGLFNVALGDSGNPIPVDRMGREMQLEIVVNGEPLSPRQPLYGAPYAFSLYPGAVISDTTMDNSFAALTIQKADVGTPVPALRLEGALASTKESHMWTPAVLGHDSGLTGVLQTLSYESSSVRLTSTGGAGLRSYTIPVLVPEVLYGQGVTLDAVTILYRCVPEPLASGTCSATGTRISHTGVYRSDGVSGRALLGEENPGRFSTSANGARYTLPNLGYAVDEGSLGMPFVVITMYFADNNDAMFIAGVRATYRHD